MQAIQSAQEFITARFDINITDNHRLTLNHKEVESSKLNGANSHMVILPFHQPSIKKVKTQTTDGLSACF